MHAVLMQVMLYTGQVQANNSDGLVYVWVSFGSPNPLPLKCLGKSKWFVECGMPVQGQQVLPVVMMGAGAGVSAAVDAGHGLSAGCCQAGHRRSPTCCQGQVLLFVILRPWHLQHP